jgi:predicted NUDIX family NTP pyrophosphohydrolase
MREGTQPAHLAPRSLPASDRDGPVLINNRRDDQFETKIDLAFRPTFSFLVERSVFFCYNTRTEFSRTMAATSPILRQAGVIAYRILDGKVQVLLMTSRDTGRWIIPKGNINGHSTPSKAAQKEAYEEAGVRGAITRSMPLGVYTYSKKLASGEARSATVEVYLLRIKERLKKWPEKGERKFSWVTTKEAIDIVEEPGVVPLLRRLMEFEDTLGNPERGVVGSLGPKRRG